MNGKNCMKKHLENFYMNNFVRKEKYEVIQ